MKIVQLDDEEAGEEGSHKPLEIPLDIKDCALSLSDSLRYRYLVKHCELQSPED